MLVLLGASAGTTLGTDVSAPRLASITVSNNQVWLSWTNGRPSFQIQSRSRFDQNWVNVGGSTSNFSATISPGGSEAYFRVVSDFTALYQVVFNATWSPTTHPTNFPSGSHFSGLVGGTHNSNVHFWREGEIASEGIRVMAELGGKTTLLNEISPAIANGTAQMQLSGNGVSPSPGNVSLTFPGVMRRDFSLVTLVTMIAPSPDWFVGVDGLNLIENGEWVTNKVVTLYGLDSGTDSGASYTSANFVTSPRGVITKFTDYPAIQNGVVVPFGTFTFVRLD
ncbi:MAG: spondin domain-containing protein [Verrucomicrobiota bacterium]